MFEEFESNNGKGKWWALAYWGRRHLTRMEVLHRENELYAKLPDSVQKQGEQLLSQLTANWQPLK